MAGQKAISVSQFVEHFRRAWLNTQGKFYSGQSLDRNDFNHLPRRIGKKQDRGPKQSLSAEVDVDHLLQASPSAAVPTPWHLHSYVAN